MLIMSNDSKWKYYTVYHYKQHHVDVFFYQSHVCCKGKEEIEKVIKKEIDFIEKESKRKYKK